MTKGIPFLYNYNFYSIDYISSFILYVSTTLAGMPAATTLSGALFAKCL